MPASDRASSWKSLGAGELRQPNSELEAQIDVMQLAVAGPDESPIERLRRGRRSIGLIAVHMRPALHHRNVELDRRASRNSIILVLRCRSWLRHYRRASARNQCQSYRYCAPCAHPRPPSHCDPRREIYAQFMALGKGAAKHLAVIKALAHYCAAGARQRAPWA